MVSADVYARNVHQRTLDYLSDEDEDRLESTINRNVGNDEFNGRQSRRKDSARRILELPEEMGEKLEVIWAESVKQRNVRPEDVKQENIDLIYIYYI